MKTKQSYDAEALRSLAQSISCCLGAVGTWWGVAAIAASGCGFGDVPAVLGLVAVTLSFLTIRYAIKAVDFSIAAEREEYWSSRASKKETRI